MAIINMFPTGTSLKYVMDYDETVKGDVEKAENPEALSAARQYLAATTVGNYGLFGGGYGSSSTSVVDAYDTSLTRTSPTALSAARQYLAATTVGNYGLFGGGYGSSSTSVVDAYTQEVTYQKYLVSIS